VEHTDTIGTEKSITNSIALVRRKAGKVEEITAATVVEVKANDGRLIGGKGICTGSIDWADAEVTAEGEVDQPPQVLVTSHVNTPAKRAARTGTIIRRW